MKEQGQKYGFTDLNVEIKHLVELATCSHKLRRYSFQNPDKSLSELLTIAKFFEGMKIYVEKVGKRDVHPFNALHQAPHRSSKKGSLNRRGTSSYNKIFIRSGGVSPHKGKCPPESKFCYKCKKILYTQKVINSKSDNHKDSSRQNPHSRPTPNRITHSPSVSQEHESKFGDEVYSDKYLFMTSICLLIKI